MGRAALTTGRAHPVQPYPAVSGSVGDRTGHVQVWERKGSVNKQSRVEGLLSDLLAKYFPDVFTVL